jgi:aspartate-semialdehyde dehydrogenase
MKTKNTKIKVGVLGATGAVGQKLVALLNNHPWFELTEVAASENSAGKNYAKQVNWKEPCEIPQNARKLELKTCDQKLNAKILFSGLDSSVAGKIETHYADLGYIVVSNSKNHRMDPNVPLIIPEINGAHLSLIKTQKSKGTIITNPNCSTVMLAITLFPIYKKFGLTDVIVTTMQAISGAGYPGVPSLDILGNVIPHIKDEEEKIATETLKIFGDYKNNKINFADFKISAMCNRVPVRDGHTMAISFATKKKTSAKEIIAEFAKYSALDLPSAPKTVLQYFDDPLRPQPMLDINAGNGMTVSAGNLRPCGVLDWKITAFGHNTIRGAAGAAILNAELFIMTND